MIEPSVASNRPDATDGIEVLSEDACLDLLRAASIGRIGLSSGSLPVILPVNFVVDRGSIVVCTGPGLKLRAAVARDVACLEVDDHDPVGHLGWSVLVTGRLSEIAGTEELREAARLPLAAWREIVDPHFVQLTMDLVSGRRLHRERSTPPDPIGLPPHP